MSLVTVIIPCRNEVKYISNLLNSIINCDYPLSLIEIIIVDGMSNDGTRELIINNFAKKYNNIFLVDNKMQKTPFAFNLGVKKSKGDFIIILGSRFKIVKNYISQAVKTLKENKEIGCLGGVVNNVFENKTSQIISLAMSSPFGIGFSNFRSIKKDTYVDTVTAPCFRKDIFNEIGYFDEKLTRNQDDDFSFRLLQAGYKILLKSNISLEYNVRTSFQKLFFQYKQYGYWKVFVNKKHKSITTLRQLFPMLFLISIFVLSLSIFIFPLSYFLLIFELTIYLFLSLFFSLKSLNNSKFKIKNIFLHMYTCLVLHVSYGLGYIEGCFDFLILNRSPKSRNEKLSR